MRKGRPVEGFIPHALVTVFADKVHIVGQEKSYTGQVDVPLKRALKAGEMVTATQEIFGLVSEQSYKPVVTLPELTSLGKPAVGPVIYACGRIVPISGLSPSNHIEGYASVTEPVPIDTAHLIGTGENTGTSMPVVTQALKVDWFVVARQVCCIGTNHELDSKPSAAIKVSAEPHPLLPPSLDDPIPGNDVANLRDLYVGADIKIKDETAHSGVGGGLATGNANWTPVHPDFNAADFYDATQALCTQSKPSPLVRPTGRVPNLTLHSPIRLGDNSVIISGSVINAVVALYKTGVKDPIGFGGAVGGDLTLSIALLLASAKHRMNLAAGEMRNRLISNGLFRSDAEESLAVAACRSYLQAGLDCVLVGMRHVRYVEELKHLFIRA